MIIDGDSTENVVSTELVEKLGLKMECEPKQCQLSWVNDYERFVVKDNAWSLFRLEFTKSKYSAMWCQCLQFTSF